jgi:hypothetical protein
VDGGQLVEERGDGGGVHGMGVDDGLGVGVAVDREVHGEFAAGPELAYHLLAVEVDADRVSRADAVVRDAARSDEHQFTHAYRHIAGRTDHQPVRDCAPRCGHQLRPGQFQLVASPPVPLSVSY